MLERRKAGREREREREMHDEEKCVSWGGKLRKEKVKNWTVKQGEGTRR